MKRPILLFTLFWLSITLISAQPTIDWQQTAGANLTDNFNAVINTPDEGFVAVGYLGRAAADGQPEDAQAHIVKYDKSGKLLWAQSYGGTGNDIFSDVIQLSSGNFVVVGENGSKERTKGEIDAWILELDANGKLVREYLFGGALRDNFKSVRRDGDNIIALGSTNSIDGDLRNTNARGYEDVLLATFSLKELLPVSARRYGGDAPDYGFKFCPSASGSGFVITAITFSNNGDVSGNKGNADIWVFEIETQGGKVLWQRCFGSENNEGPADIVPATFTAQNSVGYVLAGNLFNKISGYNMWVGQIDLKGNLTRQNEIGGSNYDDATAIAVDTVDKTFVIGGYTESKDGIVLSQHGKSDMAIAKIDTSLRLVWHKCLGGSEQDGGSDIATSKTGLIVVGRTASNDGNVTRGRSSRRDSDSWIVKLNRKNLSFFDDRQVVVRFRDGFSRDSALFYQKLYGAKQVNAREKDLSCAGLVQLWQIDSFPIKLPSGETLNDIVAVASTIVEGKPAESSGEPNYAFSNGIDIDSIYNTPQFSTLPVYAQDTTFLLKACERNARDSSTILAIIDGGIDSLPKGHPLHQKYLWKNLKEGAQGSATDADGNGFKGDKIGWDFVENDAFPYDLRGHGSHVTGIIGKMLDTHKGDSVKLMILRIFDNEGRSSLFSLVEALTYAICNNAQVVNMSLSYTNDAALVKKSIIKTLIEFGGTRQKMLAVAAAGNNGADIDAPNATERYCPAYFDSKNLLVVASVDPKRNLSTFSNYGKVSVDVAAPGNNVFSTLPNNKWGFLTGTSMSTPFVSAAAALIGVKRCNNAFDFSAVRSVIESTVVTSAGLGQIQKTGFVNYCAARQSYISALPSACIVSTTESPLRFVEHFAALPNPFTDDISIQINSAQTANTVITLNNALGKTILSQNAIIQTGENAITLKTNALAPGVYFVTLHFAGATKTLKIVKM